MQLKDLAKEPQLIKISLDDEDTVKEYGEPVEFYTWDRQPMSVYLKMAQIDSNNTSEIFETLKNLILDEDGKSVLEENTGLPAAVMIKVLNTVVETLGK
jgi:hypothetical protein|tara:strand:- start:4987 stop:5283 length:297 start_codon:yes stop_codon:yes gene_type:complete